MTKLRDKVEQATDCRSWTQPTVNRLTDADITGLNSLELSKASDLGVKLVEAGGA